MAHSTESSITIAAEPAAVLDVIADFEAYPLWTGGVRSADVLAEDEDGWAEQVRFSLDAGPISDTYTLEYGWDVDEDGSGTVSWTLVEATLLKAMDGAYVLVEADGQTEVTYRLSVELKMPMLSMVRRKAERAIVDSALSGLKKRVEG